MSPDIWQHRWRFNCREEPNLGVVLSVWSGKNPAKGSLPAILKPNIRLHAGVQNHFRSNWRNSILMESNTSPIPCRLSPLVMLGRWDPNSTGIISILWQHYLTAIVDSISCKGDRSAFLVKMNRENIPKLHSLQLMLRGVGSRFQESARELHSHYFIMTRPPEEQRQSEHFASFSSDSQLGVDSVTFLMLY
jgi:hypothetical protein